ncbi:hypothetical protein I302_103803 [Kwoniella bestiolae CBS 10118]|uniref:Uncharacterized protein n=1 Tax=Kwoniella bestiolae CBS 10118 TaxID=1296100 RepID=A0A1B9G9F2_9TREE|nr:hypothetical protein I302_02506 [Kwoniella bestiolae CBS 10118]OCF27662.1 hypothetical protein I302_02506 [Kwoniella bestiolae CBS 10118]
MPGRFLLKRAHSSFHFPHLLQHPKQEEGPTCSTASSSSQPSRSLSDSCLGTPKIECTTGPTVLRSAINPKRKERQSRRDRNVNSLRLDTLRLVQAEEEFEEENDLEIPFELDETIPTSCGSITSPAHSLLTTPTFPGSPTVGSPLEFLTSCECEDECIDPSLCNSSLFSYGSSFRNSSSVHQRNKISFINTPRSTSGSYFGLEDGQEDQCSWASSPQFLSFSNHHSATATSSRRESIDSTFDFNDEVVLKQDEGNDLSTILSGCGSLIDDHSDPFLHSTNYGKSFSPMPTPNSYNQSQSQKHYSSCAFLHERAKRMNIHQNPNSPTGTGTSPIHSPRSDENTIKSVGFKPSPPQLIQRMVVEQSKSHGGKVHVQSQLRISKLSTILESD